MMSTISIILISVAVSTAINAVLLFILYGYIKQKVKELIADYILKLGEYFKK